MPAKEVSGHLCVYMDHCECVGVNVFQNVLLWKTCNSLHCTHTQCSLKLKSEAGKINGSLCRRGPRVVPTHTANSACNKQQKHRVRENDTEKEKEMENLN